jgi:ABC-type polysaccharide/polyol phosphate transport system ATPase subunit
VSSAPSVIVVDGVSKQFKIPQEQVHTLKERVLHPMRRPSFDRLQALRDVSFDVRQGEFFGIVGRNGSGKSTLLKCLAGIYGVDQGKIYVDGRVSTFIELGVGFNMDLPARDNIMINATMLGLTTRQARERIDAIIDFAELHEFVDLRLKNYSSGMLVRLAFSVMIQVDAEVLLIDEVLAVGDASFQQKCFEEFARLRRENRTVVLVTHEMGSVERFCDRVLLLERGHVADLGDPKPVSMHYLQLNFSKDARQAEAASVEPGADPAEIARQVQGLRAASPDELRAGDGGAELIGGWFLNAAGEQVETLESGERATFCVHIRFHEEATGPQFAFSLRTTEDHLMVVGSSRREFENERFVAGEEIVVRFGFDNMLAPDRYWVSAQVAHAGTGLGWYDNRERFRSVVIANSDPSGGLVDLPVEVQLQRDVVQAAG